MTSIHASLPQLSHDGDGFWEIGIQRFIKIDGVERFVFAVVQMFPDKYSEEFRFAFLKL
jgi:hypothetical protein